MSKITELKNSSDVEYIASELFKLIKEKDANISKDLDSFSSDIYEQYNNISKVLLDSNNANTILLDKKNEIESLSQQGSKFSQVFKILDKKLDNEITNNNSLSQSEKNDLNQDFLFNVRSIRHNIYLVTDSTKTLLDILDKVNNNSEVKTPSLLDRIKSIRGYFTDSSSVKNKLK